MCGFLLLVLCLIQTKQVVEELRKCGSVWVYRLNLFEFNEITWTKGSSYHV